MKPKLYCSSCGTPLTGSKKYYRIQSEKGVYHTCVICLAKATERLKNMKRSPEEDALFNQLIKIGKGKTIQA